MHRSFSSPFKSMARQRQKVQQSESSGPISFQKLFKDRNGHGIVSSQKFGLSNCETAMSTHEADTGKLQSMIDPQTNQTGRGVRHSPEMRGQEEGKSCVGSSKCANKQSYWFTENLSSLKGEALLILQDYEKRISDLLMLKMSASMRRSEGFTSLKSEEEELQGELKNLIQQIKSSELVTASEDPDQKIDACLRQIEAKLEIFEKMIAENYSEVKATMTQCYFKGQKAQRNNFKHSSAYMYATLNNINKISKVHNLTKSFIISPALHYETTNQASFQQPTSQSYVNKASKKDKYALNRQILPRTNYQREYLNYGPLPVYYSKEKHIYLPTNGESQQQTIYMSEFNAKKAEIIDSKCLQSRKDNIKTSEFSLLGRHIGKVNNIDPTTLYCRTRKVMTKRKLGDKSEGQSLNMFRLPHKSNWEALSSNSTRMDCAAFPLAKEASLRKQGHQFANLKMGHSGRA